MMTLRRLASLLGVGVLMWLAGAALLFALIYAGQP
jgi:hypothetical protein